MRVDIAGKVIKVKGQGHDQTECYNGGGMQVLKVKGQGHDQTECYNDGGIHFNCVTSRVVYYFLNFNVVCQAELATCQHLLVR